MVTLLAVIGGTSLALVISYAVVKIIRLFERMDEAEEMFKRHSYRMNQIEESITRLAKEVHRDG